MRGRKPLPTATKEATGAFVKDPQRRNTQEPKPIAGRPTCPEHIASDAIAKACWIATCDTLEAMSILTQADQSVLALYCSTYAQWRWLAEYVKEGNVREISEKGGVTTSPEAQQVHKYADRLVKLMAELGLTPSARSRIRVVGDEPQDAFTEWLKGSVN